jgi:hypothetical protein
MHVSLIDSLVLLVRVVHRHMHGESRAFAFLALHGNAASMFINNAFDHGQSQSGPLSKILRGEEGIEDPGNGIGWNTVSGIHHLEDHGVIVGAQPYISVPPSGIA